MHPVRASKLLSRILRHDPASVGITLDPAGWVAVETLLSALREHGYRLSREELRQLVSASDKQRFALDPATDRIRAQQGHSVDVDLGLPPAVPPDRLYHGTPVRNVEAILAEGLHRGSRHDVHLSPDVETARRVGARRGRCAVLVVDAASMHSDGHRFSVSGNGVWLTREVPARYLSRLSEPEAGQRLGSPA
ncbi:MAG TPA: RNA 2'-phosphotransferase [Jatrophihabitans sp.]|nr:RNA 2'-phosphotransferase [Jatrophihabitans sp.]